MQSERLQVSLKPQQWDWLRKEAAKTGASLAELIRRALDRYHQTPPPITLGFASFKDGSFELIVQNDETYEETQLTGKLEPGQFEIVDRILPTCVYVKAKPRSNAK